MLLPKSPSIRLGETPFEQHENISPASSLMLNIEALFVKHFWLMSHETHLLLLT